MPYLVGGYPDLATSIEIARTYVESGADLVEIGIPYSDPLADGPVIQGAATAALREIAMQHPTALLMPRCRTECVPTRH